MQQDMNDFTMLSWDEMRKRAKKHKEKRIARNKGLLEDYGEDLDKIYPVIMELLQSKIIGALSYDRPNIIISQDNLETIFNNLHWCGEKELRIFLADLCDKAQPYSIPDNIFFERADADDIRSYSIACLAYRCREALEKIGMHSFVHAHADECSIGLPQKE